MSFLFCILALLSVLFLVILRLNYYRIIFPFFGISGMILCIAIDWFSEAGLKWDTEMDINCDTLQIIIAGVIFLLLIAQYMKANNTINIKKYTLE